MLLSYVNVKAISGIRLNDIRLHVSLPGVVLVHSSRNNRIRIPLVANVPVSDQTLRPTKQVRSHLDFSIYFFFKSKLSVTSRV